MKAISVVEYASEQLTVTRVLIVVDYYYTIYKLPCVNKKINKKMTIFQELTTNQEAISKRFLQEQLTILSKIIKAGRELDAKEKTSYIGKQKTVFTKLFNTLSPQGQMKVVKDCLNFYNPKLNLSCVEEKIKEINEMPSARQAEAVPLLVYLYETGNKDLFLWAERELNLDRTQVYASTFRMRVKDPQSNLFKEMAYTDSKSLIDMAFNLVLDSNEYSVTQKSIEEIISPLKLQDLQGQKLSLATQFRIKRLGSGFTFRNKINTEKLKQLELFIEKCSLPLSKELGLSSLELIIDWWFKCKAEPSRQTRINNIYKYFYNKYAQLLNEKELINLEKRISYFAKAHLIEFIKAELSNACIIIKDVHKKINPIEPEEKEEVLTPEAKNKVLQKEITNIRQMVKEKLLLEQENLYNSCAALYPNKIDKDIFNNYIAQSIQNEITKEQQKYSYRIEGPHAHLISYNCKSTDNYVGQRSYTSAGQEIFTPAYLEGLVLQLTTFGESSLLKAKLLKI